MKTYAVYELPANLCVTADCFITIIDVKIAKITGEVTLPTLHWSEDRPRIISPTTPPELKRYTKQFVESDDFSWGGVTGWNPKDKIVNNAHVSTILLELDIASKDVTYSDYLYGKGHPQGKSINALFATIDQWFERLRTWTEVITDQDADPVNPLSHADLTANGLHIFTVENNIVSLPASPFGITVVLDSSEPLTAEMLHKVVEQANSGTMPSESRILLRDSNAALRRAHYRRAVIDAGSATELALADVNNNITKIPGPYRKTLGWYVQQPAIIAHSHMPTEAMQDLVNIRNNAIHQNRVPTYDETIKAIRLAKQIINQATPLSV